MNKLIITLAVDTNFRGSKVANKLYKFVENYFIKNKCTNIILEVRADNIYAIKFYIKNGFEMFGTYEKYYEDYENAIRMRKRLK